MMKIAIPIRDEFVSPAFDFARNLLLVELEAGQEAKRSLASLFPESAPQRAGRLQDFGVDVLICGAISRELAQCVSAIGIELLAYVTGRVDIVLEAYMAGHLARPRFTLPGCWPGARNGFRRCCRRRRGRS